MNTIKSAMSDFSGTLTKVALEPGTSADSHSDDSAIDMRTASPNELTPEMSHELYRSKIANEVWFPVANGLVVITIAVALGLTLILKNKAKKKRSSKTNGKLLAIGLTATLTLLSVAGLLYLQSVLLMIKSNKFPCETPDFIESPLDIVIEYTPVCPKEYGEIRRVGRKLEKAALVTLGAAAISGVTTELLRRKPAWKSKKSKSKKHTSSYSGKPKN